MRIQQFYPESQSRVSTCNISIAAQLQENWLALQVKKTIIIKEPLNYCHSEREKNLKNKNRITNSQPNNIYVFYCRFRLTWRSGVDFAFLGLPWRGRIILCSLLMCLCKRGWVLNSRLLFYQFSTNLKIKPIDGYLAESQIDPKQKFARVFSKQTFTQKIRLY